MKMRITTMVLLLLIIAGPLFSQAPRKKEASSKREIQTEMNGAVGEISTQIADLEKQLKTETDPDTIRDLKEQIAMLQKQLKMMQGLTRQLGNMSETVYQQAAQEESTSAPKRDLARLSILPKRTLTEAELLLFIRKVETGVENMIPASEKTEALNIYNETKTKYNSTAIVANAASGCWMLGHWEKALVIMGRACLEDLSNADNLNNYAAFLTMAGAEQASIPILQYLNEKYPNNSTILNNLGQAWYGLGDLRTARKYLTSAIELYPTHSLANLTMSSITLTIGDSVTPTNLRPPSTISDSVFGNPSSVGTISDSVFSGGLTISDSVFGGSGTNIPGLPNEDRIKAINYLKASLKESYDPEKEAELSRLGYNVRFDDLPSLNFPMKKDPFGFIPFLNSSPQTFQTSVDNLEPSYAQQRYVNGLNNLDRELSTENARLTKELEDRSMKLSSDNGFRKHFLEPHNSPAYMLAARSRQLFCYEKNLRGVQCLNRSAQSFPLSIGLWLPVPQPFGPLDKIMSLDEILAECRQVWIDSVVEPIKKLNGSMTAYTGKNFENCAEYDQKINAFLTKRAEIYSNGIDLIKTRYVERSDKLDAWIKLNLYADLDEPPTATDDLAFALVSGWDKIGRKAEANRWYQYFIALMRWINNDISFYRSTCEQNAKPDPNPGADNLEHLRVNKVKCEFFKYFDTPVQYVFVLRCNTITEKTDPKLPKRQPDIQKGAGINSSVGAQPTGPLQGRGPNIVTQEGALQPGPLTAESKMSSQCSLEYNRSGNLVAFNFQLNEDGTALKDPDSVESGVDSRWCWNSIGSSKKGHLYKLSIK